MEVTAKELATLLNGAIEGDPAAKANRPARIEDGRPGTLTFLANPKYASHIYDTKASIVLVDQTFKPQQTVYPTLIRVDNVYEALAKLFDYFDPEEESKPSIAGSAQIHTSAKIGSDVDIADFVVVGEGVVIEDKVKLDPFVSIGKGSHIGMETHLHTGVKIYHDCQIGRRVEIHANTVVGSDGFGFVRSNGAFRKIRQIGNVIIEDDVEIGANVVVDRASIGSTIIRSGAKLDNLIQVAHNVEIGKNAAMAAQSGVAGSTKIGANSLIGGQAGIVGHIEIGENTEIQAQSGVTTSTKPGSKLYGSPSLDYVAYLRSYAVFKNLPSLSTALRALQKKIEEVEIQLGRIKGKS